MRYVITGGCGFIGTNLVEHLVEKGADVMVIDNLSTGKNIVEGVEYNHVDIRDNIGHLFRKGDIVVHLAALPSVQRSIEYPIETTDVNICGTLNLLQICNNVVDKFVFISSSSVYGDAEGVKSEDSPTNPLSVYALTKLSGEQFCNTYKALFGMDTIILRFFNVFGKYQSAHSEYAAVIPKFIDSYPIIYGDGTQSRDFTHVSNNVDAIIRACHSEHNGVFNIACGESYSLLDLCRILGKVPEFAERRKGDIKHSKADISKASEMLGYKVVTKFNEGLWTLLS